MPAVRDTNAQSDEHIEVHAWRDLGSDFVLIQDMQPPRPASQITCTSFLGPGTALPLSDSTRSGFGYARLPD